MPHPLWRAQLSEIAPSARRLSQCVLSRPQGRYLALATELLQRARLAAFGEETQRRRERSGQEWEKSAVFGIFLGGVPITIAISLWSVSRIARGSPR